MHADAEFKQLMEDHAATYFRGEMAAANPKDYTLEELEAMSIDMDLSTVEVDEFLRQDFQSMPPEAQAVMFNLLCVTICSSISSSGSRYPRLRRYSRTCSGIQ